MATGIAEREQQGVAENQQAKEQHSAQQNRELQTEQTQKQEIQQSGGAEHTRTVRLFKPAVDIYETNDQVVMLADMPGVDQSSVDVTLERNVLTIYGHVASQQPAEYSPVYSEYGLGDYQRSFTISNNVDWEHIEATVKNGVLKLTLPKAGPAQAKKIAVRSEEK